MTPAELRRAGEKLYGKRWKAPLASAIRMNVVTIWRYSTGQLVIPFLVESAVRQLLINQSADR